MWSVFLDFLMLSKSKPDVPINFGVATRRTLGFISNRFKDTMPCT
jgi:hypothetical protein